MSDTLGVMGTVKNVGDLQTFEGKDFTKRELLVTSDGDYPQDIPFEFVKDKCSKLDGVSVGDRVEVKFNIRSNEYNDRHYVNLSAWFLKKLEAEKTDDLNEDNMPF